MATIAPSVCDTARWGLAMGPANEQESMMATIEELEKALEEARQAAAQADRERRKQQDAAWAKLYSDPTAWEWASYPQERKAFFKQERDQNGTRVTRKLNAERLAEWKRGGPGTFSSDFEDGREHGLFYYRTEEGILTGSGGGYHVLDIPRLCSEAEWEAILRGDIPEKFKL